MSGLDQVKAHYDHIPLRFLYWSAQIHSKLAGTRCNRSMEMNLGLRVIGDEKTGFGSVGIQFTKLNARRTSKSATEERAQSLELEIVVLLDALCLAHAGNQ
jgi:hypothetical protein